MGAECCESKGNLKGSKSQINNNNNIQFKQTNKYEDNPVEEVQEQKDSEPQGVINSKELETAENDEKYSNLDRHVSIPSSIKNDFNSENSSNRSREQISEIKNTKNDFDENDSNLVRSKENNNGISTINDYIMTSVPVNNSNLSEKITREDDYIPFNCVKSILAHQEKIVCLIELHDGKIATGSYDGTIKVWNLENEEC